MSAVLAIPALAHAESFSLAVGQTKVIGVPRVTKVHVSNPGVVQVRLLKNGGVAIQGKDAGTTQVNVQTQDGTEIELMLFVTTGTRAYQISEGDTAHASRGEVIRMQTPDVTAAPEPTPNELAHR